MSVLLLHPEVEGALRALISEEVTRALAGHEPAAPFDGFLNVKSAAAYLDTSEDGIRALVKRKQLHPHRTPTGRVLFRRVGLDAHVLGGSDV